MTMAAFSKQAQAETDPGDTPHIKGTFLNWLQGFQGRYVARVRLHIRGKKSERTYTVSLRRVSRIVGDEDIAFAVFSIGTLVPPRWRTDALHLTHSVVAQQWIMEAEAKAKQQNGGQR